MYTTEHVLGPEDNLWLSVLSFHHVGLGDWAQVASLGSAFPCWAISEPYVRLPIAKIIDTTGLVPLSHSF